MEFKKALKIVLPIVLVLAIAVGIIIAICIKNNESQTLSDIKRDLFVDGEVDFEENGKWGIRSIDKVIIKPKYDSISNRDFYETIFGSYTENPDCSKYYKKLKYRFGMKGNLGYLGKDRKVAIDCKYGGLICLDGTVQAYKEESDWRSTNGIIDENGKTIIDHKYEYVGFDRKSKVYWGSIVDKEKGKNTYTYFDEKGKEKTLVKGYECYGPVVDGLITIRDKKSNKEGFANVDGEVICKPKYGKVMVDKLSENKIPFKDKNDSGDEFGNNTGEQGRIGFLNTVGKVVIEPQYNDDFGIDTGKISDRYYFRGNRAIVHPLLNYSEDDKDYSNPENNLGLTQNIGEGVVDEKGNYIIQPKYESIIRLKNGNFYFEGTSDGYTVDSFGLFTKDGELICENNVHEDDYSLTDMIDDNVQIVSKTIWSKDGKKSTKKYGLINEKGKLITDIVYDRIGPDTETEDGKQDFVHHNIVVARRGEKFGYINAKTGKEIGKFEYLGASRFYDDGYAVVINNRKKAEVIDTDFKSVLKGDGFNGRNYEYYSNMLKYY